MICGNVFDVQIFLEVSVRCVSTSAVSPYLRCLQLSCQLKAEEIIIIMAMCVVQQMELWLR